MKTIVPTAVLAAPIALPAAALAGSGGEGSRQAAGGGFMSSDVSDPYHDPRSQVSQRAGTGQFLGQPMVSERTGGPAAPQDARRTIGR